MIGGLPFDLLERLEPAVEILLQVIEDDGMPDEVFGSLGAALMIIIETAEDVQLGLIGATPEQRVSARPEFYADEYAEVTFDPSRCASYVRAIYADELIKVRTVKPEERKCQLQRASYALARVVAAGALPAAHVRESLVAAASDQNSDDVATIIESSFRKGLTRPRTLPEKGDCE